MNYCFECGTPLELKKTAEDGDVPFCSACNVFRFPIFSTAISTAILNREMNKILLLQQTNRNDFILLAGYIGKGENAEDTLVREVQEEVGLNIIAYEFMRSRYFERTNTLMLNFIGVVDTADVTALNGEVEKAVWFSLDDAVATIKDGSLAKTFLLAIVEKIKNQQQHLRYIG